MSLGPLAKACDNGRVVGLSHPMLGSLQGMLEAQGYVVHRLWENSPQAADVQAIVHAGEISIGPQMLEAMPKLGLIACISVGYEGIDLPWCRARGIAVSHSTGLNAEDVADHAVGALICAWRGLIEGDRTVRSGAWRLNDRARPRRSLKGARVGIVGLGHIGMAAARRLEPFGAVITWWGPRTKPDARWPMADTLMALARDCDILLVACRGGESNRRLIDRAVIEALGPEGCLVNVSRGLVVDEDALIAALGDGRLGMAALDVFEDEPTPAERWAGVPNTVLTPHIAGATVNSLPAMTQNTFENLSRFFAGEPLVTPVPG